MNLDQRILIPTLLLIGIGCSPSGANTSPSTNNVGSGGESTDVGGRSSTGGTANASGGNASGGVSHSSNTGGTSSVSTSSTGTQSATGGSSSIGNTGGKAATGGTKSTSTGGTKATGGSTSTGGKSAATGGMGTVATTATGGRTSAGGSTAAGGSKQTGGSSAASTGATSTCSFGTVTVAKAAIATVGTIEFTAPSGASNMQVVWSLNSPPAGALNTGGIAPVDTTKSNNHTLLLGLKQSSTYTVHVEAKMSDGSTCKSADSTLTTGSLSGAPSVTRTATNASGQAKGYIVTCTGQSAMGSSSAYIVDADGAVVWSAAAPGSCSRAHMDYEGVNMWMEALNVQNSGGEMRFMSMDGVTSKNNVSGLSSSHHDFTVMPKKIVALVWTTSGMDPESNLVQIASDGSGSATTLFKVGSNLYLGGQSAFGGSGNTFHANSVTYQPEDGSFTIGDRNPNCYVHVSSSGAVQWQLGGTCTNAPAGASKCVAETWKVNHGHHYMPSTNTMLLFNNGQSGASHVFEFKLSTSGTMTATSVKDFTSGTSSGTLGDVQRLPNGNTLITYSNGGQIIEVDSSWSTLQTLKGSFGYADWRETLYGPPPR